MGSYWGYIGDNGKENENCYLRFRTHKPPPFKGPNIRIPIRIPIKEEGLLIRGLH